jgi:hypothetical protein
LEAQPESIKPKKETIVARLLIFGIGAATAAVLSSAVLRANLYEKSGQRCLPERVVGIAETAQHYYSSCSQK